MKKEDGRNTLALYAGERDCRMISHKKEEIGGGKEPHSGQRGCLREGGGGKGKSGNRKRA